MKAPFILIFLNLSICFLGGDAQVAGFRLTQQWPAAFCNLNPGVCVNWKLVNNFTIHGLWPYDSNGRSLVDCQGSAFNIDSVSSFGPQLDRAWPNFKDATNEDLWEYEWNKHGKCSESILSQRNYFYNSLSAKNAFDILEALTGSGLCPHDQFYTVKFITDAIKQKLSFTATLVCKTNANRELLVSEIYVCLNQNGQAFTDCPETFTSVCGSLTSQVKFIASSSALQNVESNDVEAVGKTKVAALSNTSSRAAN